MKTWQWIAIGILVLLIIVYAVYAYNKNQERKRLEQTQTNPGGMTSGSSKFADFLNALFPFYKEYESKNG